MTLQLALNTGALAATIATSTASDPIGSVLLGLVLFHESLHLTGVRAIATLTALAIALLGWPRSPGNRSTPLPRPPARRRNHTAVRRADNRPERGSVRSPS